jgi:tripeptide aminopeptidase
MNDIAKKIISETTLLQNFLRYVQVDTQADPKSETFPSSDKEKNLGRMLAAELTNLGVKDAAMDEWGYVYGRIPSNCESQHKVAFLAHMDVSPDAPGEGVKPLLHTNFDGQKVVYPDGRILTNKEAHGLSSCKGHTLITSDGTTLLGADDKAGIAAIMAFVEFVQKHPEIKHPEISICFTPDEEIGNGVAHIDVKKLDAHFGYTVDGHLPGEINYENFFAWGASVKISGRSHHPGDARGNMVNAIRFASEFVTRIPRHMTPETTMEREPFIHVHGMSGCVENASLNLILRAFTEADIAREKDIIQAIAQGLETEEPRLKITVECKEQYKNMQPIAEPHPCVQVLDTAIRSLGLSLQVKPIRGGTDGARLSYMGVPCPNIFTGGSNFHSISEWTSLENMAQASATLVALMAPILTLP